MAVSPLETQSHSRYDPLTDTWVLVSPHRLQRPWQGHTAESAAETLQAYEPDCYLCPGNERANGARNPDYTSVFVFDNDYPALLDSGQAMAVPDTGLLQYRAETGRCKVICFDPRHDRTLASLDTARIRAVVAAWSEIQEELAGDPAISYVQIFENKGEMMGCSNPHPHCQVWATQHVPTLPLQEDRQQRRHFQGTRSSLLLDYLGRELACRERLVDQNEDWVVLVPFWAVWPFETMLIPRHPIQSLTQLDADCQASLADLLASFLPRYDRLFGVSMPYSMGWHGAPCIQDAGSLKYWQLHAHYYPPLLRSATVRKFLVGFEMLSQAQRDITPEQAARRLREV